MPKPRANEEPVIVWPSHLICQAAGISSGELGRRTQDGSIQGKISYGKYNALVALRSVVDALVDELARVDRSDDARITNARAEWFELRAARARLELGERAGELVSAAAVTRSLQNALAQLRQMMLSIPATCAPWLVGVRDPRAAALLLERPIREALEEFGSARIVDEDEPTVHDGGQEDGQEREREPEPQ